MTFNTGNPIGSTDARDRSDNSENLDLAVNSLALTFEDRLGVTRDTLEGIYQKSAYYRAGTFSAGYTLTNNRQTLAYGDVEYSWSGAFPKVVAAKATPATSGGIGAGAWVDRTQETIRAQLSSTAGSQLIYHDVYKLSEYIDPLFDEYGFVVGLDITGAIDVSARINAALAARRVVKLPAGDFKLSSKLVMNNKNILIGSGSDSTRLFRDTLVSPFDLVEGISTQRVTVTGIWFDSVQKEIVTDGTKRRSAIRFWDNGTAVRCNKIKVTNCEFTYFTSAEKQPEGNRGVITFEQVNKAQVSGCTFDDNHATCIYWYNAKDIRVHDNDCTGETTTSDPYGVIGSFTSGIAEGVSVSGNRIRNTAYTSINVSGTGIVVEGNDIDSPVYSGVSVNELDPVSSSISIIGNTIRNPGIDGISIFEATRFNVSSNAIYGANRPARAAIHLYNATAGTVNPSKGTIVGNDLSGSSVGLRARAGKGINVVGNTFRENGVGFLAVNLSAEELSIYLSGNTFIDNTSWAVELNSGAITAQKVYADSNKLISTSISTLQPTGFLCSGSLSTLYTGNIVATENYVTEAIETVFTNRATKAILNLSGTVSRLKTIIGIPLNASTTYDPPSLTNGTSTTTTVTVTGAVVGDFVDVSFGTILTAGYTLYAWVSAANTVSVRFSNSTGATVDLASGTLYVSVRKY